MFWIESCVQRSRSNRRPAQGKGVCSDSNWTTQRFQMAARKSLETMSALSGVILNRLQPNVVAQISCKWNVKFESHVLACSDQSWLDEFQFSYWRFFEQSAFVNKHLLCYWPTIHNSISTICPKFQVLSFAFSRLMSCSSAARWALSKLELCTEKIIQLQSLLNKIRWIGQRFSFKNSAISCLALIFKYNSTWTTLRYARTTILYATILDAGCEI